MFLEGWQNGYCAGPENRWAKALRGSSPLPSVMIQLIQQPLFIFAATALLIAAASLWLALDLRAKWLRLFGKKPIPDGELMKELIVRVQRSETKIDAAEPRIGELEKIAKISLQKAGFLRFNPFHDTGGDQSFSLALLDGENNGVVVSSLYTREGARIYAKEIKGGKAKQALSGEEQKVLEDAVGK